MVGDHMRYNIITVGPEATLGFVLKIYGSLTTVSRLTYVIDKENRLLGLLSMFDLIQIFLPKSFCEELDEKDVERLAASTLTAHADVPVTEIMRKDVASLSPSDSFLTASRLIQEKKVTAVPVLEDGRLVGEISRRTILQYLARRYSGQEALWGFGAQRRNLAP
jgi:CBS domain-containing protein